MRMDAGLKFCSDEATAPTAPVPAKPGVRLSLSELLGLALVAGFAIFLLAPYLVYGRFLFWPSRVPEGDRPLLLGAGLGIVLFSAAGAWAGRWWSARMAWSEKVSRGTALMVLLCVWGAAVPLRMLFPDLLRSRIWANESAASAGCRVYCEAQDIYHRTDWDGDGVLEFQQKLCVKNSLYEGSRGTGDLTLVNAAFANAAFFELGPGKSKPMAGYYFKILKGQGPNASYIENENMAKGYALVAWPAEYGWTGTNTYIINNWGSTYYKDLGPDTHKIIEKMEDYNLDQGWVLDCSG